MQMHRRLGRFELIALLVVSQLPMVACTARGARIASIEDKLDELTALNKQALRPPGHIDVHLSGRGANTTLHLVTPPVQGVCKQSMGDCAEQATWRLLPSVRHLPNGWRVEIVEKSTSSAKGCFTTKVLNADNNGTASSGTPAENCQQNGAVWSYDVILYDGATQKSKIDPLLVMYNY